MTTQLQANAQVEQLLNTICIRLSLFRSVVLHQV
jgi:hypothetical protein